MGFAYVTVSDEDRIALLSMDDDNGSLDPLASFHVPGRPAPLARHPNGRFLYVGRRDDNQVSSYSVEESGGDLRDRRGAVEVRPVLHGD